MTVFQSITKGLLGNRNPAKGNSLPGHQTHFPASVKLGTAAWSHPARLSPCPSSQSGARTGPQEPSDVCKARMRMVLLGAPGSGKGTHSQTLVERFDISMIGVGDLLRLNVEQGTEMGKLADSYISKGDLLPDQVIVEMMKPELQKLRDRDWVLDGFPRTKAQAIQLDSFLSDALGDHVNLVISLEVPDRLILERISGRWIHARSGRVYNTTYNAPLVEGKDDFTGEPLTKRKDDTVEVFANRLKSFHQENVHVLDHYGSQYMDWSRQPTLDVNRSATPGEAGGKKLKKLMRVFGSSSDTIWPQIEELIRVRFPSLKVKS